MSDRMKRSIIIIIVTIALFGISACDKNDNDFVSEPIEPVSEVKNEVVDESNITKKTAEPAEEPLGIIDIDTDKNDTSDTIQNENEYTIAYDETVKTEPTEPIKLQFMFKDGSTVSFDMEYFSTIESIDYMDITGDGVDEVIVNRYFANTATEYNLVDVFQVNDKDVIHIFPTGDIPELQNEVCDAQVIDINGAGQSGKGLHIMTYEKYDGETYVAYDNSIFYSEGRWCEMN